MEDVDDKIIESIGQLHGWLMCLSQGESRFVRRLFVDIKSSKAWCQNDEKRVGRRDIPSFKGDT